MKVQKITSADNPEVYLNAFNSMAVAPRWQAQQKAAIFILCLIGPVQQAMDTMPMRDVADYQKVWVVMLQTLNLSLEACGKLNLGQTTTPV